jgi:predicted AlkP superfamily phosphohydrolase/phosphomutase
MCINNNRKVFILGLDGGSWQILRPLMEQGYLPSLQKLCESGVSGILQSTKPPYTGPAWVSSISGVNPGKHGIFGFTYNDEGSNQRKLINSKCIKVPKIWQYLEKEGKTSGLINIPVTYPVEKVNGFMISGFLAPQKAQNITYPYDLHEWLLKKIGAYIINVKIAGRNLKTLKDADDFIYDVLYSTRQRFEAMKVLWSKYSPDFFMIVFNCFDKIQHMFWKYLDCNNPLYFSDFAKKIRPKLIEVYFLIDKIIEYILKTIDKRTTLYIISDHGFGPMEKRVFINKWLVQQGLLTFSKQKVVLSKLINYIKKTKIGFSKYGVGVSLNNLSDWTIDYHKTICYCSDSYEQGLYFNKDGNQALNKKSFYRNEIESLKKKLMELRDPLSGEYFVDEVKHRSEVYWGPFVKQAPDLLLKMKNYGYLLNRAIPFRENLLLHEVNGPDGCHREEGIFAAYGNDIISTSNFDASIMDVTPTVLYNMGFRIPENLDGRVLQDIFSREFRSVTDLIFDKDGSMTSTRNMKNSGYSHAEEAEIRKRLSELGYFD